MLIPLGLAVVLGSVFGGFALAGGKFGPLWQPTEFLMIGGAGLGAFIMANNGKSMKSTMKSFSKISHTHKYQKELYMQLMQMLFRMFAKAKKESMNSIEADVDDPENSELFASFPDIKNDAMIMEFISDYMRLIIAGASNPHEIDELMMHEIEEYEEELNIPAHALAKVGDALPAFGIVAAVMGVVKALSYAGASAEQMGAMIGHALVGTFLGILLAYGLVSPIASRLEVQAAEAVKMLNCIRVSMIAFLNGAAPQIAVEFGRKALHTEERPSFVELEEHVRKKDGE
jgi:chemotaxis protein MotA